MWAAARSGARNTRRLSTSSYSGEIAKRVFARSATSTRERSSVWPRTGWCPDLQGPSATDAAPQSQLESKDPLSEHTRQGHDNIADPAKIPRSRRPRASDPETPLAPKRADTRALACLSPELHRQTRVWARSATPTDRWTTPAIPTARVLIPTAPAWLRWAESSSVRGRGDCSWFVARPKRATGRLHNVTQRVRRNQPSEARDPASALRSSVIRKPRSVRCLHGGTNADDAAITAAANSPMGEFAGPPPSGRLPNGRRVSLRSCRRFGGWSAHGADRLPDRSPIGRACLIVVQAFPVG